MSTKQKKTVILSILAVIFLFPVILGTVVFYYPEWWEVTRTNKGRLLNPPVPFIELGDNTKWHMVYWQPNDCDKSCLKQIDKLARVRLALGRHLYQLESWVYLGTPSALTEKQKALFQEEDIKMYEVSNSDRDHWSQLGNQPAVFLVNEQHYLVLIYKVPLKLTDIYHDLRQLLKRENA